MTSPGRSFAHLDLDALRVDLDALKAELRADASGDDLAHLKKMLWWGRASTILGTLLAFVPNPLSIFFLSTGSVARWAMVAHHVLHRGYDRIPGVPRRLTSKGFAQGWRRSLDWNDWLDPAAWSYEHNVLHHYKLGEDHDPDQPEEVLDFLRESRAPVVIRYLFLALTAMTWRFVYYAPNTTATLYRHEQQKMGNELKPYSLLDPRVWVPFTQPGARLWARCFLPYVIVRFGLMPLPFLALGTGTYLAALFNFVAAELVANVHSFLIIVPNHAGEDLYRFDSSIEDRGEFYLRQIIGSTNYRTGGDLNDFFHGWLNYQIEHHVFPDMSMLQYRKAQPKVQALCEKHGVPYVQESVWTRAHKLARLAVGKDTMVFAETSEAIA